MTKIRPCKELLKDLEQKVLFELPQIKRPVYEIDAERIKESYFHTPQVKKIIISYIIVDILGANIN